MEYSVLMSVYKKEKAEFLKEAIERVYKNNQKKQMILCWYVMVS